MKVHNLIPFRWRRQRVVTAAEEENMNVYDHIPPDLIPPERIRTWVGSFEDANVFLADGQHTVHLLQEYANLLPSHTVLDAGCGCGRVPLHLLNFFDETGAYYGFDICREHIEWCTKTISASFPNFHFTYLDVRKEAFNPKGKFHLKDITLPYSEKMFDVIWAISLFTHMIFDEMEHYVAEFSRIIKPNGTFYATFYLMNPKTAEGIKQGTARFNFTHRIGECYTFDPNNPELGIAQNESFVRKIYDKYGFSIVESIHYGDWDRNNEQAQDVIIAKLSE